MVLLMKFSKSTKEFRLSTWSSASVAFVLMIWMYLFLYHYLLHSRSINCPLVSLFASQHQPNHIHAWNETLESALLHLFNESRRILYEPFALDEPMFYSKKHRDLFLMNAENVQILKGPTTAQLIGRIEVTINRTVHESDGCGWNMDTSKSTHNNLKTRTRPRTKYQIILPLLVPQSNTFQHFVDGVLPKIAQAYETIRRYNISILLFRPWDNTILEILDRVGIAEHQIKYYDGGYVRGDIVINGCIAPPIHPILWQKMRKIIVGPPLPRPQHFKNNNKVTKGLVVLLDRLGNRNPGRNIVNFVEVSHNLSMRYPNNFQLLGKGRNLNDSIQIFQQLCIFIGVHGGAMYNLLFTHWETSVIEIMPTDEQGMHVPEHLAHTIIWKMTKILGQPYWRMPTTPVNHLGDVWVNLTELNGILDVIESSTNFAM